MTTLLNANTSPVGYPLTAADLRAAFPNTSFPRDLDEATVAEFNWHLVTPTPRPADSRIERYDDTAQLLNGTWQQVWVARAATTGEQDEWDATHQPEPDWKTFKRTLLASPEVNALLSSGVASQAAAAAISLPATVINSESGSSGDFRATWVALRRAQLVPLELMDSVRTLALACHLPQSFLESIGGAPRPLAVSVGQEWVSPDGVPWVVRQARDQDGQFLPDDPSTEARESLEWVEAG